MKDFVPQNIDFLKNNMDLVDSNQWEKLFIKAANTKGIAIAELIYCLVDADLEINGISDALNKMILNHQVLMDAVRKHN